MLLLALLLLVEGVKSTPVAVKDENDAAVAELRQACRLTSDCGSEMKCYCKTTGHGSCNSWKCDSTCRSHYPKWRGNCYVS